MSYHPGWPNKFTTTSKTHLFLDIWLRHWGKDPKALSSPGHKECHV